MSNPILPFQTERFLRLLRKAQLSQDRAVQFDGLSVFSTEQSGSAPCVDVEITKYMDAVNSMLQNLMQSGYLLPLDPPEKDQPRYQLTDMGWHYGEVSFRAAVRVALQSVVAPLVVSVIGTYVSLHLFR